MREHLVEDAEAIVTSDLVLEDDAGNKRDGLAVGGHVLENTFELGKLRLDESVLTVLVVAQVHELKGYDDADDASDVSVSQVSRLSDPHHEDADQEQAVVDVVLFLDHQIGGVGHDEAHDDHGRQSWIDEALRREGTPGELGVDEAPVVLPLPP